MYDLFLMHVYIYIYIFITMSSFHFARYTIICLIYAFFAPIPTHPFFILQHIQDCIIIGINSLSVSLYLEHLIIIILLDQNVQNEMLERNAIWNWMNVDSWM